MEKTRFNEVNRTPPTDHYVAQRLPALTWKRRDPQTLSSPAESSARDSG